MFKYFEINESGHNIRCKLYYDKNIKIKKVILFGHGFAGHKDNKACENFSGRILSKYKGVAVMIFNLPSHGDDVKKKILMDDCMDYMNIVLNYIKTKLNVEDIYSYATSFGGYLILKYIHDYGNPFKKIALRSPAVNMYETLTTIIKKDGAYENLLKGRSVSVGFDRKIDVDPQFLEALKNSDVQQYPYYDYTDDMLILHGTKDEVVPFDASQRFADDNIIEFIPVEGADHRFQKAGAMELATKTVISFFEL